MSFGESRQVSEPALPLSGAFQMAALRTGADNVTNISVACRLAVQY